MKKNLPYILVGAMLIIALSIAVVITNQQENTDSNDKKVVKTATPAPTPSPTPKEDIPKVDVKSTKTYYFVDLLERGEQLINKPVQFSAKVDEVTKDGFIVSEGFGTVSGFLNVVYFDVNDASQIKAGDYVTVTGTVTERSTAYLYVKGASIIKTGNDIKDTIDKDKTAYLKAKQKAEQAKLNKLIDKESSSAKAYINSCTVYPVAKLTNNDKLKGNKIGLKLKIKQVNDGGWLKGKTYYQCVALGDDGLFSGKTFAVIDSRKGKKIAKLKKDYIIVVYGTFNGQRQVDNALLGTSEKVPAIDMHYCIRFE